jgi:hypothetical protein
MIGRFLAALVPAAALALAPPPAPLPPPRGLAACAQPGPVAADMQHMAAALHGQPLGCFQSGETAELRGTKKTYSVPVAYAFAVEMKSRRFTQQDLSKLMSAVTEQWKNSDRLSQDTRADYDRRLDELIAPAVPRTPKPEARPKPSVLVSIEQPDENFQTIVVIVRRQMSFDGEFFDTTRLDAAAVVLKGERLIRLSLVRDLRSKGDVGAIREEIADWAAAVAASP